MNITKKTHFNPCFWTALWSSQYFKDYLNPSNSKKSDCRKETVHYLEINSNEILNLKTEDIFFEKKLGLIDFDSEELKEFIKKYYPKEVNNLSEVKDEENYILDFENHFTALEKLPPYQVLMKMARSEKLETDDEKINLGLFLIIHSMRNHVIIKSMLELYDRIGQSKLEYFMNMRFMLTDTEFLFKLAYKIGNSKWTIFKSKFWDFPLTDNPVINENGIIYCVLSPSKILKVETKNQTNKIHYKSIFSPFSTKRIQKMLISNTYKGMAFRTMAQAQRWKNSNSWSTRRKLLKNSEEFNKIIESNEDNELWQINQFSNKLK